MAASDPAFLTRLLLAWSAFFRIIFDGSFAARVQNAAQQQGPRELTAPSKSDPPPESPMPPTPQPSAASPSAQMPNPQALREEGALMMLGVLQTGRLIDFLRQEVATFEDADVGAAARVVHEGCRKALADCVTIEPLREESEGALLLLEKGFARNEVKLTGELGGSPPYRGKLRHRGWRAVSTNLPFPVGDHDASLLCPAEVEL